MAQVLYATCSSTSGVESVQYSDSHVAPTSMAVVTALSTSLQIGHIVTRSKKETQESIGVINRYFTTERVQTSLDKQVSQVLNYICHTHIVSTTTRLL